MRVDSSTWSKNVGVVNLLGRVEYSGKGWRTLVERERVVNPGDR